MSYANVLVGLLSLASFHRRWLRPIDAWEPTRENLRHQVTTLARHLLAVYPVPAFDGRRRVLTIEVDLATRTVVQARRRCNRRPNSKDRDVMERWRDLQVLKLGY